VKKIAPIFWGYPEKTILKLRWFQISNICSFFNVFLGRLNSELELAVSWIFNVLSKSSSAFDEEEEEATTYPPGPVENQFTSRSTTATSSPSINPMFDSKTSQNENKIWQQNPSIKTVLKSLKHFEGS
jgi:hypothetical protein